MMDLWKSSKAVTGGARMDLVRRIEQGTTRLEGQAGSYVRA